MSAEMGSKTAKPLTRIENDRTRVIEWQFEPGAETGFHRHEYDYVIVPLTDGRLRLVDGNGEEKTADLQQGVAYFREAGVEHNVLNAGPDYLAFVEIEFMKSSR